MKVLFLAPYPMGRAPSQRFRFELFLHRLDTKGIKYHYQSFWNAAAWDVLYGNKLAFKKFFYLLHGFAKRNLTLLTIHRYDLIFIHREAAPIGPPIFEWIIGVLFRKRIVYDFDDAIWIPNTSNENRIARHLKWHSKVGLICRWSWKVSAGNSFLAEFARHFSNRVEIIPTVVNTHHHHPRPVSKRYNHTNSSLVVGWTGSHSTLKYLNQLIPILIEIQEENDFQFRVIADKDPNLPLKNYCFIKWNRVNEIRDLQEFDIGIMPLEDDVWAQSKCGFKAIQYGALAIPALVSPIGVNTSVVKNGETGFWCAALEDWKVNLIKLINSPELRDKMGENGRNHIVENYSMEGKLSNFMRLLS